MPTRAEIRIGQGVDVHAFAAARPLVLGGVTIPFDKGLAGHSDADVLLHAICDACLGAAGAGDIGRHFPDTDERYRNIDSRELLRAVQALLAEEAWAVANVDATVIAQLPKLVPYTEQMISNIASDLKIDEGRVNIKATTTENLGMIGRGEGIAAMAVVLLQVR